MYRNSEWNFLCLERLFATSAIESEGAVDKVKGNCGEAQGNDTLFINERVCRMERGMEAKMHRLHRLF